MAIHQRRPNRTTRCPCFLPPAERYDEAQRQCGLHVVDLQTGRVEVPDADA